MSFFIGLSGVTYAQNPGGTVLGQDSSRRVITTAVQFLLISPDARAAGMGDVGAATSADANATHWNPAKLVYAPDDFGVSVSFSPWLSNLVNDMSISYLSAYKKISDRQAVAASLRYFDMGSIQFTDQLGNTLQDYRPREFALDGTYSFKLSEKFSMAGTMRFIHSNLAGGISTGGIVQDLKPGNTFAVDLSVYYKTPLNFNTMDADLSFGANISNVGAKISYTNPQQRDYIPANLRIGSAFDLKFNQANKLTFALDLNKMLVPTPPVLDENGNVIAGQEYDRSLLSSVFGSFTDAPDGFSEELKEFIIAFGAEYWYNDIIALRAGYYAEAEEKGDRNYFTLGLGLRYQMFGFDFAYLVPNQQNHPLSDTLRFSLLLKLNKGDKVD
ncbi:MAG: type IX secretion system outer membrane channel protein PorV [Bacteroidota bacterium]